MGLQNGVNDKQGGTVIQGHYIKVLLYNEEVTVISVRLFHKNVYSKRIVIQ